MLSAIDSPDGWESSTTATGTLCGACGTEPARAGAQYCDACGSPIASLDRAAEFKQVTVLFADVVHSMDIAAAVGSERLREIMTELVNRSGAVVQRYGGTVDKFTGDGIMAVFGAPVTLEDHAIRACLAALDIQTETQRLADEVERQDGIALQLRVGLNSGQVIVGEIGSGALGYTAVGEQVGMAQRMESVAPPGGVMVSESTARLVEDAAVLDEPEMVRIKGADLPVPARRLMSVGARHDWTGPTQSSLVGRELEMTAITGLLDRSINGRGCVVGVVGPAGIGKSRLVREVAAVANSRGVEVFSTFCESHASDIPFRVLARLLRAVGGIADLDDEAARARVRSQLTDADAQDLVLLDDLLGIRDPDTPLPRIDPDARRRRLTALINAASLARTTPALYIVEDAHWIDEVSESMLADFHMVIPQTPSMVLTTCRPDYRGALTRLPGAHTIALAPLDDSETLTLVSELLGPDPSIGGLATMIVARAGGNPFFAQEIVRDLAERGVLLGRHGAYACSADVTEVSVPATLQAAIAARIDRLGDQAKRTLNAGAVIGLRFGPELLSMLEIDAVFDELVNAELIDQVQFTPRTVYAFRHPLIRTVAYESQLKSDRAGLHRRLAAAIEARDPAVVEENSALIAKHWESAGEVRAAYAWHMRAGAWSTNRDIAAARISWERARQIADSLSTDDPDRITMCIAPRTMLCGNAWRAGAGSSGQFEELRELCTAAGDKASLAIGSSGQIGEHMLHGRVRDALRLIAEQTALIESIADPTLTVALSALGTAVYVEAGELTDLLQTSQRVIEMADGDPMKGNFIFGSPLAGALVARGIARWWLGHGGWQEDLANGVELARSTDPPTYATVTAWKHGFAIANGVLVADDKALCDLEEALRIAEESGNDIALSMAKYVLAVALWHRDSSSEHQRGLELLGQLREMCLNQRFFLSEIAIIDFWAARERARRGDFDGAIQSLRQSVDAMYAASQLGYWLLANIIVAETLLERGGDSDVADAEATIDQLAVVSADHDWVISEVWLMRLRALLARAKGDESTYSDFRDRYRKMATDLGFEGHMALAEAMT